MGVPKFAAWITKKYPQMVQDACPPDVHGLYIDLNGLIHPCCHSETDPSVAQQPESVKLNNVCIAVETLVATTTPRQVVYIAIDGVAPRAKMNQQRARRYMGRAVQLESNIPSSTIAGGDVIGTVSQFVDTVAAIEREFTQEERATVEDELDEVSKALEADSLYGNGVPLEAVGADVGGALEKRTALPAAVLAAPPKRTAEEIAEAEAAETSKFDSNCLSPGTEFMTKVAAVVRAYVEDRLLDPTSRWYNLTVIISDTNTPGEGEHKLIDFLRTQSSFSGFNGHGSHVIAGSDADLVFLALSLHIPQVYILRDNDRRPPSARLQQPGAAARKEKQQQHSIESITSEGTDTETDTAVAAAVEKDATTAAKRSSSSTSEAAGVRSPDSRGPSASDAANITPNLTYQYFSVDAVGAGVVSEIYELCRVKSADVATNYDVSQRRGDHVAANGYDFDRTRGRADAPLRGEGRTKSNNSGAGKAIEANLSGKKMKEDDTGEPRTRMFHPCTSTCNSKIIDDFVVMAMLMGNDFMPRIPSAFCGESAMDNFLEVYVSDVLPHGYLTFGNHDVHLIQLRRLLHGYARIEASFFRQYAIKSGRMTNAEAALPLRSEADERCWRTPYYQTTTIGLQGVQKACTSYIEGIRFVWRYYTAVSREVSWSWYYPFHHGPFAVDLGDFLGSQGPNVQLTLPPPKLECDPPNTFAQLLCILPPSSRHALPAVFHSLMVSPPPELADTFPRRWVVDYTAAFEKEHLAAVLMPFANMEALKAHVSAAVSSLSAEELVRLKNCAFHVVLQRKPDGVDSAASGGGTPPPAPAEAASPTSAAFRFQIQGDGIRELTAGAVPWELHSGIYYKQLCEISPDACRPRTYSFTVPIPNLSLRPDGSLVPQERRPFRGRARKGKHTDKESVRDNSSSNKNGKGGDEYTAVVKFPFFGEFLVCVSVAVLIAFACVLLPLFAYVPTLTLLIQATAVAITAFALALMLGILVSSGWKGFPVHRNNIYTAYVDWLCPECNFMNFSRNVRCFFCQAPCDPRRAWGLFSGKGESQPPLMDPNHTSYCVPFGFA